MRTLFVLLLFNIIFCMSLKAEKIDSVAIVQIKNKNLLPILDSIVSYEKQLVYYTPKLYFSIRSRIIDDTLIEFQIASFGSILVEIGNNDRYKGCFEHNGHWFFVTGQEFNESVFIKTNQKKAFMFRKPVEYTSDGRMILNVIEDDRYSNWIYHYVNDDFILEVMW